MMAGIRGKNTKPELLIRQGLHAQGLRFRLHCRDIPGQPDICFRSRNAVIFVHGCFWHAHECHLFKWPKTRPEFWQSKIAGNRSRDEATITRLHNEGWRVLTIWECALKGIHRHELSAVIAEAARWLAAGHGDLEIGSAG
jgi:DNA mismatch endonuclease (patch repair protein)